MRIARVRTVMAKAVTWAFALVTATGAFAQDPEPLALGDSGADLVYTPVTPCRIIDTRLAGGVLAAGAPRDFHVVGTAGFDTQGGLVGGCGIPSGATAVMLNFVAVSPAGPGNLRAWAFGQAAPLAAVLNYAAVPGLAIANGVVVPLCNPAPGPCALDLTVSANASATHLVVDALGYMQGIATESVTTDLLANDAVTLAKLGSDAVDASKIVNGSVGSAEVDSSAVQLRVSGICAAGSSIRTVNADGTVACQPDTGGGGTVTSVGTGAGLTGGPITTSGTVAVATGGITSSLLANAAVTSAKIASGAVGLSQIDAAQVQARVSGTCPPEATIQHINPDGSVVCRADTGTVQPGNTASTLDSAGTVGQHTSVTIGADGLGLISYYDNTNADLKVAHCLDVACTTVTLATLDSTGVVGQYTSVTIGADGLGLISYFDNANFDLEVAHCLDVACTSATLSTLDSAGDVGRYTSVTIGADGLGLISYYDLTNTNLKVAHCADVACTTATLSTLDSAGIVGQHTSVTIGADGLGLISYWNGTNGDLEVAHCADVACTTATLATLDSTAAIVGQNTSVTIGADGLGLISYWDVTNFDLKVAHCANVACTTATVSTLDSASNVGQYTSVTIGADGLGLISYYDFQNGDLEVAHCSNLACTSAILSTLGGAGAGGLVGQYTSVTIGADGLGLISYYDQTNSALKVAHCGNVLCSPFVARPQ